MFRKVETQQDMYWFNKIWMKVWHEKGFEYEFTFGDSYLIYKGDQPAGTVQFMPYLPDEADDLHSVYPFYRSPLVRDSAEHTAIIDKVAILKEYRSGHLLDILLYVMFEYAERYNKHCYIALLDPPLYRVLRLVYRFPIEKLSGKIFYKGADVIPVIIDMKYFLSQKLKYRWYNQVTASLQKARDSVFTM